MADNLVFEESLNTEVDTSEFISKRWVYVNDNNNGNYTSQVVIDSTPLSNSGSWINWQEAFIVMPLVVQLTNATEPSRLPDSSAITNYSWAFKNGFWQMLNSMTVEFNNQNIIQQTPFLNVFRSFKCMTSWSKDDLENHGASSGVFPDSANSWTYSNVAGVATTATTFTANGQNQGVCNNRDAVPNNNVRQPNAPALNTTAFSATDVAGTPTVSATGVIYAGAGAPNAFVGLSTEQYNEGLRNRQAYTAYDPIDGADDSLGQSLLNDLTACNAVYRSSKVQSSATGGHAWNVYAKLRLKDLGDFFEKCPLLKGSTMRFYINTNQTMVNFSVLRPVIDGTGAITNNAVLNVSSVNTVGGLTNPLMIASADLGQGSSPLYVCSNAGVADNLQLSVSIFKNNFNQTNAGSTRPQTALNSCRLYAPIYVMNPIAESKYLSLAPTKRIKYNDIFQYQFNSVGRGSNFNFLVSNGINNIQSVLVIPFVSKDQTQYSVGGVSYPAISYNTSSFQTPVSSAPATPDPIMLTNFNIMISGVNLFLNNENYDYEAFLTQLAQSNQINGGLTTGLSSGLISEAMFSKLYRYYYGNCSRILPSEEGVSRSVQIIGQNMSQSIIDLMVFVEFQREIVIDVATGARIE
jgi:hypothetical protein